MSVRLQVLMDETELQGIRAVARQRGVTVSEWVRQAIREAFRREATGDRATKLQIVREAARHDYPTADIDVMLDEIARGYGDPSDP